MNSAVERCHAGLLHITTRERSAGKTDLRLTLLRACGTVYPLPWKVEFHKTKGTYFHFKLIKLIIQLFSLTMERGWFVLNIDHFTRDLE